jgi:succinate dehydrogenase / fumarate reductase flavoprotein subunit/L-aspartate oxidase
VGYPEGLKELIKVVEKTRPERVERKKASEEFPALSMDERDVVLKKFHPDVNEEGRREIAIGPSKGYRICHEMVDLLEAYSRVDPAKVDLSTPDFETDVLVIGGGGSGTAAALLAQEQGAKVTIATKLRHGDANTMMAEGGIQAATKGWKDSPYYHYLDILGGGHFTNVPELAETLAKEAPSAIQWLLDHGCNFSKEDDGTLKTMHGGGTCRKRMHFAADITGAEMMRTVRDEARNREADITTIEFSPAVELVLNDKGQCAGAVLYNMETEEYVLVKAKSVVMATGGSGRLHVQGFMTTNHYGATGDGIVMAYRAGVPVCYLHTIQYHPTGVVFPEQAEGILITEKFRGAGSNLLNVEGNQFVFEREPRDVEAACIIKECTEVGRGVPTPTGKFGVWLDSPMLDVMFGEGYVKQEFPGKYIMYKRFDIDISKEPMLIYPTLHYQNGGLEFQATGETSIPGLFVAGEVGGGIHGENRLMGNSLLDIMVFGRISGRSAGQYALNKAEDGALSLDHVAKYNAEAKDAGVDETRIAPLLLPDYTLEHVKEKQLTAQYEGSIR